MTVGPAAAGHKLGRFPRSGEHFGWGQACGEPKCKGR